MISLGGASSRGNSRGPSRRGSQLQRSVRTTSKQRHSSKPRSEGADGTAAGYKKSSTPIVLPPKAETKLLSVELERKKTETLEIGDGASESSEECILESKEEEPPDF